MERLIEELQAELALRNRQIAAIYNICRSLSAHRASADLLEETLAEALQAVQSDAGSLLLYDARRDRLVFEHVVGPAKESLLGREMEPSRGICGRVFTTGKPSIDPDVRQSPHHAAEVDAATGYTTRNMVTIPLMAAAGKPIGVLQVLNKHQGQAMFDEQDVEVLMALSSYAAAIQEAKLAEVVQRMGDISHHLKNLITPVTAGTHTLQRLLERFFQDLEGILATPSGEQEETIAALREKIGSRQAWYPEVMQILLGGSRALQDCVREVADCVRGIVAEPTFEPRSINDIVNTVAAELQPVAAEQHLTIDTQELGAAPLVPLDQKLILHAIYNLVYNAIPETPPGGTIWIRTGVQQGGGIFPEGHYLLIEVADNGRGMPEEVREGLFTRGAGSTKPGGTGLGIRIVKNAVEAHHGQITVASQPGVGTTFQIKIPLERPEIGKP